ncbi:hypothetical protein [Sorangium sp. So ce128]|uniref:hypothetical protein n=1 Tax=Sorangium sp. So ce128 TaxID=3133281 RepID=UPI003F5E53D3
MSSVSALHAEAGVVMTAEHEREPGERHQEVNDTAAEHGALTLADQEHRLLVTSELDAQVVLELQGAAGALDALEARGAWDALHEHRTLMDKLVRRRPPETPVLVRNSASASACLERGRAGSPAHAAGARATRRPRARGRGRLRRG